MTSKTHCKMSETRLASMKREIMAVPLWQHMSAEELATELGYSSRYLYGAIATLRARGELAAASPVTLLKIRRYHKLNTLLANEHGNHHIDNLVRQIYGTESSSPDKHRRNRLRELINECKKAGFSVPHEKRIHNRPLKAVRPMSFIPFAQVNREHLEHFIYLCKLNGGRHAA